MTEPATFHPKDTDLVAIKRADGNLGLATAILTPEEARRLARWIAEEFHEVDRQGQEGDG